MITGGGGGGGGAGATLGVGVPIEPPFGATCGVTGAGASARACGIPGVPPLEPGIPGDPPLGAGVPTDAPVGTANANPASRIRIIASPIVPFVGTFIVRGIQKPVNKLAGICKNKLG